MTENTKTTYTALDVGKFLCALLILFYHYFSEHGPVPALLSEALSLYAVGVALFMVISGFLSFNKLEKITGTADRWNYICKQVKRILKIYLLWSVPYLVYSICRWDFGTISAEFVFWKVQGWVFNSTFYTIWFMPALAIGLVLTFWITEKLPEKVTVTLAVILYAVGSMTLTYSCIGELIPGFESFAKFSATWLGGSRGWLFFGFPLILIGSYMVKVKNKMKPLICAIMSVISVILLLAEALMLRHFSGRHTGIDMTIMMVPTCFFILGFLISFKLPHGGYSIWMRNMSVLIFMTQRIFLTVIPHILPPTITTMLFTNVWFGSVAVCGGTVVFSAIIIVLSKRIKWIKNLY